MEDVLVKKAPGAGFTLIELMIVVALVALLAGIAYPSYREQIAKAKRADAASALLTGAQALERHYTTNGSYLDANNNLAAVFPVQVPDAGTAYYIITSQTATANTFTLRATRTGSMVGDTCGDLEINAAGARTLQGNSGGKTVADCWRR